MFQSGVGRISIHIVKQAHTAAEFDFCVKLG